MSDERMRKGEDVIAAYEMGESPLMPDGTPYDDERIAVMRGLIATYYSGMALHQQVQSLDKRAADEISQTEAKRLFKQIAEGPRAYAEKQQQLAN